MNWKSSTGLITQGVGEPEVGTWTATATRESDGDWLCVWCLNRVANENDRFSYEGKDEFTFSNPGGIRFDIITFSEVCGCQGMGTPTLEHTWFAGHAWSYCECGQCGRHLGWFFAGQHEFAGLIRERIVRALGLRN